MAEETESIRKDSAKRQVDPKTVNDWSGRRFIPPKGSTLPADGIDGEVFMLIKDAAPNQLYQYDESEGHWSTIGPRT